MEYTRTFDRTFSVGSQPLLRIGNRRGELTIRAEERDDIHFTAQLVVDAASNSEAEERFATIDLPMNQHDDTVEIGPPDFTERDMIRIFGFSIPAGWRGPRMDMTVAVPLSCRVEGDHRTGTTRIEGLRADVRVKSRTGRIQVFDVEGQLEIEARTGAVEVRDLRGNLRVETRTGKVEAEQVIGDAVLTTRTGTVSVRGVTGAVTASTRTGTVKAIDCEGRFDLSTRTGSVEYRGRVTNEGSVEVTTGRITLAVTRDSSFFIDARSERGSVRSELSVDDLDAPPTEDSPTVRLRTTTGSIRIVPA